MKRIALAAVGVVLMAALTGCGKADLMPLSHVAQAATGFVESAKVEDLSVTLSIEPLTVGENHFVASLSEEQVTAVEAQVIMASMGHGQVVDLEETAPGRWESTNHAIEMDGRWMIRLKTTLASGQERVATFHMVVK